VADTLIKIGPRDHGQRMSLDDFAVAEGEPGHLYELAKGVIVVVDVPRFGHGQILQEIDRQIWQYYNAHPGLIKYYVSGADACLRLPGMESERHPDRSIYLLSPPPDEQSPWDSWIPSIVIEVVSQSSVQRDYEDKQEEYLAAGVMEYWIIDPQQERMLVLQRQGDRWRERPVAANAAYSTGLLPGFTLDLSVLFATDSH
jgi:Uma2 family endonuclease